LSSNINLRFQGFHTKEEFYMIRYHYDKLLESELTLVQGDITETKLLLQIYLYNFQ
jgi:hypothetical protein